MDHLIRNLREAFNRHGKLHGALDGRVEELVLYTNGSPYPKLA
nr:MAG TPA: hypothetical protein [Caudoviricetes sp.]